MGSKSPAFKGRASPLTRDLCNIRVTSDDYERMVLSRAKADGAFADRLRAQIGLLSEELARNGRS